jgi:hypothetical protein
MSMRRTAWWGWEDSNFQPNDYQPLALSIEPRARLWDFLTACERPGSEGLACTSTFLCGKNSVSSRRPLPTETLFKSAVRLLRRKAEHLVLAGPLRRQVGEASNADAMRQPAIDGRLEEIGCEEGQRDVRKSVSDLV